MGGGDGYAGTVEVENDSTIELGWLTEATTFADTFLARLKDPSIPDPLAALGTGDAAAHATLYKAFRRVFPNLDVACLDPEDPLGPYLDREFWSPLLRRHGHLIPDPTMLTLLRPDCRRPHGAGNAMLVPRLKFLCIELARTREGLNDPAALAMDSKPEQEPRSEPASASASGGDGVEGKQGQQQQLVMRRTPKYSAIGVAKEEKEAAPGGSSTMTATVVADEATGALKEEEDVERVVAALMAERGIGEDASEEVRAVVRAELKRQLEGYRQAALANRAGVAEQARESRPPSAYRRPQGQPPVLGANHVASLRSETGRNGLCVLDGVIDSSTLMAARAEAERMKAAGRLKPTPQRAAGTRFDSVRWLDERELEEKGEAEAYPTLARLVRMMKSLASEVEEGGQGEAEEALVPKLLVPKYCMIAVYEGEGALYVPHRDNTPRAMLKQNLQNGIMGNDREVTAILYLNPPDWDAQRDGGCLRCYLGAAPDDEAGTTASEVVDVNPKGGRLVMFRSRDLLHEVCSTHESGKHKAVRWALSIWILGRTVEAETIAKDPWFVVG